MDERLTTVDERLITADGRFRTIEQQLVDMKAQLGVKISVVSAFGRNDGVAKFRLKAETTPKEKGH